MKNLGALMMMANLLILAGCQYETLESQSAPTPILSSSSVVVPSPSPTPTAVSTPSSSGVTGSGPPPGVTGTGPDPKAGVTGTGTISTTPAWSPRSLSNIRFYYESANITNSSWPDSTGNVTGQTIRGSINMVTTDGFRALSFDGSLDGVSSFCKGIATGDAFAGLSGTTVSFTVFVVAKPSYDSNGSNDIFGVPNLSFGLEYPSATTTNSRINYGDIGSLTAATASETFTNAYEILEWSMSAGNVSHMSNGTSNLTLGGTLTGVTISDHSTNSTATIGGNGVQSCFIGRIAEIIMYNRALSASERGQVVGYLKTKFGI